MDIKIKIGGSLSRNKAKQIAERNKYEEVALFLDCPSIQELIREFRNRLNLNEFLNYDKIENLGKNKDIRYSLSEEELVILSKLHADIEYLENLQYELYQNQQSELNEKYEEINRMNNPYYLLSSSLKKKLRLFDKENFLDLTLKAIFCGEIKDSDWKSVNTERTGARNAIFIQRKCYWFYRELPSDKRGKEFGYGYIGKKQDVNLPLQTVRSQIESYIDKLSKYNNLLSPQLI